MTVRDISGGTIIPGLGIEAGGRFVERLRQEKANSLLEFCHAAGHKTPAPPDERAAVIISHDLMTTREATESMVMEDGPISERGTHAELMERGGVYARLYLPHRTEERAPAHGL